MMNPEHYRVRIEGKRTIFAAVSQNKLSEIDLRLSALGASSVGPSAWLCDIGISVEQIALAVGELADGDVIYLAAQGEDRIDFGFLVAPKIEGGIVVGRE